jgi:hypothetical protein
VLVCHLQGRRVWPASAHPGSLLLSFILGSGCGAAGAAAYGTSALSSVPSGDARGAGAGGPSWAQHQHASIPNTRWWDTTLGSLLAAASFTGATQRSRVAQLEAAPSAPSLGPHFIADAAAKALPAVVNITVNHSFGPPSRGMNGFGVFGTKCAPLVHLYLCCPFGVTRR